VPLRTPFASWIVVGLMELARTDARAVVLRGRPARIHKTGPLPWMIR
jgi:hypothetical protein